LNERDTSYQLHWFMYQSNGTKSLFSRLTFHDNFTDSQGHYYLPETIIFNEVKIDSTKVIKFPLDQSPNFKFNKEDKILTAFGQKLNLKKELSNAEVIDLIQLHKNWKGQIVDLP